MKLILVILLLAVPCFAQTPNCAPAPSGLVGWWKGEGNALDSAGTNNGVLVNGAGFAPGEVGQGFSFTGPDQGVLVPDAPELDPTNGVSVEAWVLLTSYPNTEGVLVVYKNVYFGPGQYAVSVYQTGSNSIFQASVDCSTGDLTMYGWKVA